MIVAKRVYDKPGAKDGFRILVDRLWPRGVSKDAAKADLWLKDIAPSAALREWFSHDAGKWREFKRRYAEELECKESLLDGIRRIARKKRVTLLYASRDASRNNAIVLKERLEGSVTRTSMRPRA